MMTQELTDAKEAIEAQCLKAICADTRITSVLYDLNLLPEQLERGTNKWNLMVRIVVALSGNTQDLNGNDGRLWPVQIGNSWL